MLAPIVERRKILTSNTPMSIEGVIRKTTFLLILTIISGVATYLFADTMEMGRVGLSALTFFGLSVGLVLMFVTNYKPDFAKLASVPYALCEGVAFGAFSAGISNYVPSIPLNAFAATAVTAFCVLGLYATGIIKVTQNFRSMVTTAITALIVLYALQLLLMLFGLSLPFLFDGGVVAIGFSVVSICLASCYLVLDFDEVEERVAMQADNAFEWVYAMGILSTLAWIYLEFLRLFKHTENASF